MLFIFHRHNLAQIPTAVYDLALGIACETIESILFSFFAHELKGTSMHELAGIKVCSLALNLPGPCLVRRLIQTGAQVIKVEPPQGDPLQNYFASYYAYLHQGVEVIQKDLKNPDQYDQLMQELRDCDLFITSFRPQALRKLKLDWDRLHQLNPRLSWLAIFGGTREHPEKAGHDLTYMADSGLLDTPRMPVTTWADLIGAQEAYIQSLLLLRAQKAAYQPLYLGECLELFAQPLEFGLTHPQALLGGGSPHYNLYPAKTGYIAVATLETHFSKGLLQEIGIESGDFESFGAFFKQKTAREWEAWAQSKDLPIVAVKEIKATERGGDAFKK